MCRICTLWLFCYWVVFVDRHVCIVFVFLLFYLVNVFKGLVGDGTFPGLMGISIAFGGCFNGY